ncbi:MAG: DUF3502 domain-containing protein [Faecalimonas umbilicata]|uniref:DUF3502 domain-containing protein n=1 Tax=Faecalimonas umbilicata TaxID=1912855 RepID=UPI00399533A3
MQALIVDDDIATVDVVENSIDWKSLGVTEIFTAYNISRAKEILSERNVDIIISDIEMPKGSGIDLLEWIRENEIPGEFLFLTCYEKFDYAAKALKNHASEYLLKPFDINVMEVALKKIVLKIKERQQLIAESEYGKWAKRNSRQMKLAFWNQMISGHLTGRGAAESIAEKQLNIDAGASYRLVISKIARPDQEKMNQGLMLFIIENIHSEILCGNPENECILSYPEGDCYVITTIYKVHPEGEDASTVPYTAQLSCGTLGNFFLMHPMEGTNPDSLEWEKEQNETAKTSPAMGFTFDSDSVKTQYTAVKNVISQYLPGLICGSLDPDTEVDKFVQALNDAGYQEILKAKQEQLDTWAEGQK